jgi:histone deacetylase 1/2
MLSDRQWARVRQLGRSRVLRYTWHSFRLTCPYTSQQNGRPERILRTLNDSLRALLFHASIPLSFWPDTLSTATARVAAVPTTRPTAFSTVFRPLMIIFESSAADAIQTPPRPRHMHKLEPRSVACMFLGYLAEQRGYRCYDPSTHRIIMSRHVYFDEDVFPFAHDSTASPTTRNAPSPQLQEPLPASAPRRQRTPRLA